MAFISIIEQMAGRSAGKNLLAMQTGDVVDTSAGAELLEPLAGFRPNVGIKQGVESFVTWYRDWSRPAS